MLQLYYYPKNASLAPHLVLEHLNKNFELLLVDRDNQQQKSPAYLALNPAGRIPTLIHDDLVIFESSAICLYLCEQHPESTLIPKLGEQDRAHFYQWLMYLNNTVQSEFLVYFYPEKYTMEKGCEASIIESQEIRLMAMFDLLDKKLNGESFLVGNQITVCDYFLLMVSIWGRNLPKPALSYQNLGPYLENLAKQKVVRKVFQREKISLTG
ncbi:MAG: glutathione S-transferase family protein [Cocleimonas sp.]